MTPDLRSSRLRLRPLVPADAAGRYAVWMADPEVTKFLESRFTSSTEAELEAYVRAAEANPAVHFFAIELEAEHRHVGNIKLGPIEEPHRRGDIGIVVGERDCWGKGYAAEAIELVTSWALGELRLAKVTAGAYSTNIGSIRAFERAGYAIEAVRPRHYLSDGAWVDAVLLARFA